LASGGDHVLLEGLKRTDFSFSDESPQQQRFDARQCVRRDMPFPQVYKQVNFGELRVDLAGFEEWLKLESIIVDRENFGSDDVHVRVSYKEWKLEYPTVGGHVCIESVTTGSSGLFHDIPSREAKFSQHYYLIFRPDAPTDESSLRFTYTKLEELLTLLIGTYHRLAWPILVSKEEPFDAWNTVYFDRGAHSVQPINLFSIWVPFARIREALGDLFRNWLIGSESFGAGYYLYVSSLRNPHIYSEDRFVNLVWGVEALHRKWLGESEESDRIVREKQRVDRIVSSLPEGSENQKWLRKKLRHAHEPSLEARVLECLRKLPFVFGKAELEKFAKACADRRNDISHSGGPRENVDYDSFHQEISRLSEALDHLFHALLLHQIGLSSDVILKVMTDSIVSERIRTALAYAGLSIQTVTIPHISGNNMPPAD